MQKLAGSYENKTASALTIPNWFSAEYQKSVEEHIVLNNCLSPLFIRVHNQIDYTCFNKLHMALGVLGKNKYLFEQGYINAYYGADFVGEEKLREYVRKMKFVQDTLQKLGKEFIFIQAPGKASFYPEYIPDSLLRKTTDQTNYYVLRKLLDEYNINYIDFRAHILTMKKTSPYPLYTETGIHWSKYAMALVMDSINNFVEQRRKIDIPDIYWKEIDMELSHYEDNDIEGALNLLFPMSMTKYAYPNLQFESHKNKTVPKVLMIGDSYLANLFWGHFFESYDSTSQYWFYNKTILRNHNDTRLHRSQVNVIDIINKDDIIILGGTEPNIKRLGFDFIDKTYAYYKDGITRMPFEDEFAKKLQAYKKDVKEKGEYQSEIQRISEEQKVSLDSACAIKCIWLVEEKQFQ